MTNQSNSTQDTDRISSEEMVEMFGSEMPIEAVNLLWGSDGSKTCGELRAELRRIAKARPSQDTEDVVARLGRETSERLQYVAQTVRCLVNPDGPDAIKLIQSLSDRIDGLEGRIRILVWNREKGEGNSDQGAMNAVTEELAALHQEGTAP